jgi:hypothetical protein
MFPTRSLLIHVDCPDFQVDECRRPSCPLAHNNSKRRQKHEQEEPTKEREAKKEASGGLKRKSSSTAGLGGVQVGPSKRSANSELSGLLSVLNAGPQNAYVARKEAEEAPVQQPTSAASSIQVAKVARVPSYNATKSPLPGASTSQKRASAAKHSGTVVSSSSSVTDNLTSPSIPRLSHPGSSPVPYSSRQTSLRTLFTTFHTLYSPLVPRDSTSPSTEAERRAHDILRVLVHHYASQDSLSIESKIFKNSNVNFLAYRNSIRTSLVGLARRQKTDREAEEKGERECVRMLGMRATEAACHMAEEVETRKASPNDDGTKEMTELIKRMLEQSVLVGTNDEVNQKMKMREERLKGTLDQNRLKEARLVTEHGVLESVGYPYPDLSKGDGDVQKAIVECWGEGGRERDLVDTQVMCDRCGVEFKVAPLDSKSQDEKEACCFHWGRRVRDGILCPLDGRLLCRYIEKADAASFQYLSLPSSLCEKRMSQKAHAYLDGLVVIS